MNSESIDRDVSRPTPRPVIGVPDDGLTTNRERPSSKLYDERYDGSCTLCGIRIGSHSSAQAKVCVTRWEEMLTPGPSYRPDEEPEYADLASPTGPEGDPVRPMGHVWSPRDADRRSSTSDVGASPGRAGERDQDSTANEGPTMATRPGSASDVDGPLPSPCEDTDDHDGHEWERTDGVAFWCRGRDSNDKPPAHESTPGHPEDPDYLYDDLPRRTCGSVRDHPFHDWVGDEGWHYFCPGQSSVDEPSPDLPLDHHALCPARDGEPCDCGYEASWSDEARAVPQPGADPYADVTPPRVLPGDAFMAYADAEAGVPGDDVSPDSEDPCICGHRRGWHDLKGFQGCDAATCECVSFARASGGGETPKQREGRAFEEGFKQGVENERSLTDEAPSDALGCAHCATRYFQVLGDLSVVCFHGHYRGVLQPVGARGRDDDPLARAVAHMASAKATPGPAVSDYFPLACACSEVMRRDGVHGPSCPLHPRPSRRADGVLARRDVTLWRPAENAIQAAVDAVEATGASIALTDAVILLAKAQNRVADHIEGIE